MKKSEKETSVKKKKIRNDIILAAVILVIAAAGLLFVKLTKVEGNNVIVKINAESDSDIEAQNANVGKENDGN
jgi:hypothetical protein